MIWARSFRTTPSYSSITCPLYAQSSRSSVQTLNRRWMLLRPLLRMNWVYQLSHIIIGLICYPVYVRGEAYLAAHQGSESGSRVSENPRPSRHVLNEPIGALAHLQLGRAYAMQGDTAKSHTAYQDFLTLWKDADPDIPILIAAKAESAKLK